MSDEAIIPSSTNQIWPGSVPEPADDPAPDPTPPPDDALPACPVCGAPVMFWSDEDGIYAFCSGDMQRCAIDGPTRPTMAEAAAEWRRIARAAALLRAVERIDASAAMDVDVLRVRGVWKVRRRIGGLATLADALIELARKIDV